MGSIVSRSELSILNEMCADACMSYDALEHSPEKPMPLYFDGSDAGSNEYLDALNAAEDKVVFTADARASADEPNPAILKDLRWVSVAQQMFRRHTNHGFHKMPYFYDTKYLAARGHELESLIRPQSASMVRDVYYAKQVAAGAVTLGSVALLG